MTKVVINTCFGGFSLSTEAEREYLRRQGKEAFFYTNERGPRGGVSFDAFVRATEDSLITYTFTEDKGDRFTKEEWVDDAGYIYLRDLERDDPDLVSVVEELGERANGSHAALKIVEVPDGVEWAIEEYDGREWIAEKHRTWS